MDDRSEEGTLGSHRALSRSEEANIDRLAAQIHNLQPAYYFRLMEKMNRARGPRYHSTPNDDVRDEREDAHWDMQEGASLDLYQGQELPEYGLEDLRQEQDVEGYDFHPAGQAFFHDRSHQGQIQSVPLGLPHQGQTPAAHEAREAQGSDRYLNFYQAMVEGNIPQPGFYEGYQQREEQYNQPPRPARRVDSVVGGQTPVSRMTGGDTHHYVNVAGRDIAPTQGRSRPPPEYRINDPAQSEARPTNMHRDVRNHDGMIPSRQRVLSLNRGHRSQPPLNHGHGQPSAMPSYGGQYGQSYDGRMYQQPEPSYLLGTAAIPKLPSFSGDGKAEQPYTQWRYQVRSLMRDPRYSASVIKQAIHQSVRGTAANMLACYGEALQPADILAKFDCIFGDILPWDQRLTRFTSAEQQPGENVVAWSCRLTQLFAQSKGANPTAEDVLLKRSRFFHGMTDDELKEGIRHVFDDPRKTFDDLFAYARGVEYHQGQKKKRRSKAVSSQQTGPTPPQGPRSPKADFPNREILESLKAIGEGVQSLLRGSDSDKRTPRDNGSGKSRRGAQKGDARASAADPPKKCERCGRPGHTTEQCFAKKTVDGKPLNGKRSA